MAESLAGFDLTNLYLYIIVALLPLSACMTIFQVNPYHALVIRGLLGAVAALVYTILGAADVALTEALVGTLLAITLYAITVRSSLVMRLGVLKDSPDPSFKQLMADLRTSLDRHFMRLERVSYASQAELEQALQDKEIHAACQPDPSDKAGYQTQIRVPRLYEILQAELPALRFSYVGPARKPSPYPSPDKP